MELFILMDSIKNVPNDIARERKQMLHSQLKQLIFTWQVQHKQKLTLARLSEETGLTLGILNRLASGKVERVHADSISALCRFFQCGVGDILEYIDDDAEAHTVETNSIGDVGGNSVPVSRKRPKRPTAPKTTEND